MLELDMSVDAGELARAYEHTIKSMAQTIETLRSALHTEHAAHARTRSNAASGAMQVEAWISEGAQAVKQVAVQEKVISAQAGQISQLRQELAAALFSAEWRQNLLKHLTSPAGSMAVCEWSDSADAWIEMTGSPADYLELLAQVNDDMTLTREQAGAAWEARQAPEIARLAAANEAKRRAS